MTVLIVVFMILIALWAWGRPAAAHLMHLARHGDWRRGGYLPAGRQRDSRPGRRLTQA